MEDDTPSLLTALRLGGDQMRQAQAQVAFGATHSAEEQKQRSKRRAQIVALLAADFHPTDRLLARWLLMQEIAAHRARGEGAGEALYTLVALVARFGQPEDALLIWQARQATPQTQAGIDVEQMARAGIDRVRAWLTQVAQQGGSTSLDAHEAREALAWLDEGAALGAFDDLPGYFAWADERFGLHTSGPT